MVAKGKSAVSKLVESGAAEEFLARKRKQAAAKEAEVQSQIMSLLSDIEKERTPINYKSQAGLE